MKIFIRSATSTLLIIVLLQGFSLWRELKIDPLFKSYNFDYLKKLDIGFSLSSLPYPEYISGINGFSGIESLGRWTDSSMGMSIIHFNPPLPKKFVLEIRASAYGPNSLANTRIICGNGSEEVLIGEGVDAIYTVPFNIQENGCDSILFKPPSPISPELFEGKIGDKRKLGLRLVNLRIRTLIN